MANIKLADGREIRLDTYYQDFTYGGLLAGLPDERMNQRLIGTLVEFAGKHHHFNFGAQVALIPPRIMHEATGFTGKLAAIWQKRTGSNVSPPLYYPTLPAVRCIAHFMSGGRKDMDEIWSVPPPIIWTRFSNSGRHLLSMRLTDFKG